MKTIIYGAKFGMGFLIGQFLVKAAVYTVIRMAFGRETTAYIYDAGPKPESKKTAD